MFRQQSRSGSQIISAFTAAKQDMQIRKEQQRLFGFYQTLKSRKLNIQQKLGKKSEKTTFQQNLHQAQKFKNMDQHKIPLNELESRLKVNVKQGLSQEQALQRLKLLGPNKLTQRQQLPWFIKLLKQFITPFALLLQLGGILSFIAYALSQEDKSNLYLGIVLLAISFLTGIITFYQNAQSAAMMDSFKNFIPAQTIVIRNGIERIIDAQDIVQGDIVKIQTGKRIPADIRILVNNSMKVDNSSLTGQTQLLSRSTQTTNDNPLQTKNLAFFSTMCKQGSAKAIVLMTGDRTVIGQIANLAASASSQQTPLSIEIERFVFGITIFALLCGAVFFGLGFVVGYSALTNFIFAIGIIVGNVPEGLLTQVTVILTITAKRMATKKVLVKNLQAVETLGSTSCICSDKTGTLTMNKMTVQHMWYQNKIIKADSKEKFGMNYEYQYDENNQSFKQLHVCAIVSSVADFDKSISQQKLINVDNNPKYTQEQKKIKKQEIIKLWQQNIITMLYANIPTTGDASETALIKFFQPIQDIKKTRESYLIPDDFEGKPLRMPFNSTNKYAFTIVQAPKAKSYYTIYIKGAPERIWAKCRFLKNSQSEQIISSQWNQRFDDVNKFFGKGGERVLGFAKKQLSIQNYPKGTNIDLNKDCNKLLQQCTFLGLISLTDPPRDNVPYSVLKCQSAGIKVIMVTGDQPTTALAIAKQCNIISQKTVNQIVQQQDITFDDAFHKSNAIVVHGDMLTKATAEDQGLPENQQGKKLSLWLSKPQIVFARTSPAQKLIIVKGCQKLGHIVAVTGDGVNDSPAIKKADIGIAMGITGTDVAKDAADMILMNDDFSAIVIGIEQGRKIFDNLKKSICYTMTSQIPQILPYIFFIIFRFPLPLTAVIILCIDLGTDILPAMSLSFEPGELDLMTRRPRNKMQHLVTMKLMLHTYSCMGWIQSFGGLFAYFVVMQDFGFNFWQLFVKANIDIVKPNQMDQYNPNHKYFGNSNCPTNDTSEIQALDWLYNKHAHIDLRMAAITCEQDKNVTQIFSTWNQCKVKQISPVSNRPICYTAQALKYAQSGLFCGIVIGQIMALFCVKTRKLSLFYQGIGNPYSFWGLFQQIFLSIILTQVIALNTGLGIRDLTFRHYFMPAIPFALLQLIYDQTRKYLIRNAPQRMGQRKNWFEENCLW